MKLGFLFGFFQNLLYYFLMSRRNKNYIKVFFINFFKIILRIVLFPLVIIYFFVGLKNKKRDKDKIAVLNMTQIDTLSGVEFENFLCELFKKLGYDVKTTKASHDYGADLLAIKNGKKSIVQAKCYSKIVGIKAIQEIVGAKQHYGADEAIVATNNFFSKDAEVLAIENGVKLIDRQVIEKMLSKFDLKIEKQAGTYLAMSPKAKDEFNRRYQNMI